MNTGLVARLGLASALLAIAPPHVRGQCLQLQAVPGIAPGGGSIEALVTFNDGSGTALYAGGSFTSIGTVPSANRIAKWNGSAWSPVGTGLNGSAQAMVALEGLNPALYVGGSFTMAGSASASRIAKWDGASWSNLGSGLSGPNVYVSALALFDDGSGTALYVGGAFTGAGGLAANSIAKWNGSSWSALGAGSSHVRGLCVYDDGTGPALYATGGGFMTPQGPQGLARWRGAGWEAVGGPGSPGGSKMTVFNDGSGPALYVNDGNSGTVSKWDGTGWTTLPHPFDIEAYSLQVFDDGVSPALYAAGFVPGGLAKWDGSHWTSLTIGALSGYSLAVFQDGSDPAPDLYIGGGSQQGSGIAKWIGCPAADTPAGVPYCFGDGTGSACPCDPGQAGNAGGGCRNHLGTGGVLRAFGNANVSVDTVSFVASGLPATAIGLLFQGSQQQAGGLGITFGDGLLCVNQNIVRLGIRSASGGTVTAGYGVPGDLAIAAAGQVPVGGATRHYQYWYRDPAPFCTASTFNLTNAVRIDWAP